MLKQGAMVLAFLTMCSTGAASQDQTSTTLEIALSGPSFLAVRVHDVETASAWYQAVFELQEVNRINAEDGRYVIRILSGGGLSVELIEEHDVEQPADRHIGLFKAGLYVEDIDAFYRHLEEFGVDQDARIFFDDALNARSFVFRDSEGNRLQAFQSCSASC